MPVVWVGPLADMRASERHINQVTPPDSTPMSVSPIETITSRLAASGIQNLNPQLATSILLEGIPLHSEAAPVKRASPDEIFVSLRSSMRLKPSDREAVHQQVALLVEAEVLVGKRIGSGGELRCSLTAHPERIAESVLQDVVRIVAAERAQRAQRAMPVPPLRHAPEVRATSEEPRNEVAERQARRDRKVRDAIVRNLDSTSRALVAGVESLMQQADEFTAALTLGRNITQRTGQIFTTENFDLSNRQQKIVLEWVAELPRHQSTGMRHRLNGAVVREEHEGGKQESALTIDQFHRWHASVVAPFERQAKELLISVGNLLARTRSLATAIEPFSPLPEELVRQLDRGVDAVQPRSHTRERRVDSPEHLQSLVLRSNPALLNALIAVEEFRLACGLPSIGEKVVHGLHEVSKQDREIRSEIGQAAASMLELIAAWDQSRETLREEATALYLAYGSNERPADTKQAAYWDRLEQVGEEAVRQVYGKRPKLNEMMRLGVALTVGGGMPPPPWAVKVQAQTEEMDRIDKSLALAASEAGVNAVASLDTLGLAIRKLRYADANTAAVYKAFDEGNRQLRLVREVPSKSDADDIANAMDQLVMILRNIAQTAKDFGCAELEQS